MIKISRKFLPNCVIDNDAALVQIMAWHRIGGKPLSETILIQFTDVYMRHCGGGGQGGGNGVVGGGGGVVVGVGVVWDDMLKRRCNIVLT